MPAAGDEVEFGLEFGERLARVPRGAARKELRLDFLGSSTNLGEERVSHLRLRLCVVIGALIALVGSANAFAAGNLVVSQVYGGGGNAGASYTHDYIEIFNRGNVSVPLNGMSVQYASSTGTGAFGANSGQLTELPSVALQPGQYLLIQEFSQAAVGAPLPTADVVDATPINMSGTAGKVALVVDAVTLGCNGGSTPCSPSQLARIVDLVGYGAANFFEGAGPAPTQSNTSAAARNGAGCDDSDNNSTDFSTLSPPGPRNTSSPLATCGGPADQPERHGRSEPRLGAPRGAVDSDRHRDAGREPDQHRDLGLG